MDNERPFNHNTKLPNHNVGNSSTSSLNKNINSNWTTSANPRKRKQEMMQIYESSSGTSNIPGNELSKYKTLSTAAKSSIDTPFTANSNSPVRQSHTNEVKQEWTKPYDDIIQAIIQISDWSKEYIVDCLIVLKSAGQEINHQSLWQKCEEFKNRSAVPIHRNQPYTFDTVTVSSKGSSSVVENAQTQCSVLNVDASNVNTSSFGGHLEFSFEASKKFCGQTGEGHDFIDGVKNSNCESESIKESDKIHGAFASTETGVLICNDLQCDSLADFLSARSDVAQTNSRLDSKSQHIKKLLSAVEKEHQLLVAYKQCIACGTNPRGITFLPCGHFVACKSCAVSLLSCPSCTGSIVATVDTFLS